MFRDMLVGILSGLVVAGLIAVAVWVRPYARRLALMVWVHLRSSVAEDGRRLRALSPRQRWVRGTVIGYCLAGLATGIVLGNASPVVVQMWVCTVPVVVLVGCHRLRTSARSGW